MGSYFLGLLLAIAVTLGPIFLFAENKMIFYSGEGLVIVVGGTMAAALVTFPLKKVLQLIKIVFAVLRKEVEDAPVLVTEIVNVAKETGGDPRALQQLASRIRDPFFRDGVLLIVDRIDEQDLEVILRDRIRVKQELDESNANMLKTLGKYPPAFGLLATVIALVTLLDGMGSGQIGIAKLGPSMAVGLVGTMYGIILANFFFIPMSENLLLKSILELRKRQIGLVGVMLLKAGKSPIVVQETLNSMLEVAKRVDVLGIERSRNSAA